MATKETRQARGRRIGREQAAKLLSQLRDARLAADISQRSLAKAVGWSHTRYSRFEGDSSGSATLVEVGTIASVLGLKVSTALYPDGDSLRDAGHQALIGRFTANLSASWRVAREVPLPNPGDARAWDLVLRLTGCIVGVECETRVRDVQAVARRVHQRQRDGGADVILVVLADSRTNRSIVDDLRDALGPAYATSPRRILHALRTGERLPGPGVLLL